MSIDSFKIFKPFDNSELQRCSDYFSKEFSKEYLGILNYLIVKNKLLFYVEFKFPANIFDNEPLVNIYQSDFVGLYSGYGIVRPVCDVDGYEYSFYSNHFEDVSFICNLEKKGFFVKFMYHIAEQLKDLLAFTHLDLSFVDSEDEDGNFKRVRCILGFETFTNEPAFFLNKLRAFTFYLPCEITITHLASAATLRGYWESRIALSQINPRPFAHSFFSLIRGMHNNIIGPSIADVSFTYSNSPYGRYEIFNFKFYWYDFPRNSNSSLSALVDLSKLPIYDCLGNWVNTYSITNCPKHVGGWYVGDHIHNYGGRQFDEFIVYYNYSIAYYYLAKHLGLRIGYCHNDIRGILGSEFRTPVYEKNLEWGYWRNINSSNFFRLRNGTTFSLLINDIHKVREALNYNYFDQMVEELTGHFVEFKYYSKELRQFISLYSKLVPRDQIWYS